MAPKGQKRSKANAFNPIAPIRNRTIEIAESGSSSSDGDKTKRKSVATNSNHGTRRTGESRGGKSKATNDSGRSNTRTKRKREDDDDDVDQMGRSPRKKGKTQGNSVATNSNQDTKRAGGSRGGKSKATDNDTSRSNTRTKRKREDNDDDVDQMGRPSRKKGKAQGKSAATNSNQGTKRAGDSRGKRKATDDDFGREERPQKKQKKQAKGRIGGQKGKKATGRSKKGSQFPNKLRKGIISPPKDIFDNVYVFGANRKGELGLRTRDVREPILNAHLCGAKVGIVQIATGSSHCIALTHNNRILTWGCNLGGALGRGAPRDPDEAQQGDIDVDHWEYTPMEIPQKDFPPPRAQGPAEKIIFSQVAAGRMFSFALTNVGFVYGWGTFSMADGGFGFLEAEARKDRENPGTGRIMEARPVLIQGLDHIIKIACGENHVVALRNNGDVYTWGGTEHGCLGRRVCPRRLFQYLRPMSIIKRKISDIYCGYHHSFAVQRDDTTIQTWGWNSHGQTGVLPGQPGNPDEIVLNPQKIYILEGQTVNQMAGGKFTSAAILEETRRCRVWGRTDGGSLGADINNFPPQYLQPHLLRDAHGRAIVLTKPTFMMTNEFFRQVALGPEHGLAVMDTGNVSSWGDSSFYQIGHNDDRPVQGDPLRVRCPTIIGKKFFWAGTGDEYGMLATGYTAPTEDGEVSDHEGGPIAATSPRLSSAGDDSTEYATPPHQRDVSRTPPRRSPQPPPLQPSRGTESEPIEIGSSPAGDVLSQPDVKPAITSPQCGTESEPIEISSSPPSGDVSPLPDVKPEITSPQPSPELPPPQPSRSTIAEPIDISSGSSSAGDDSRQPRQRDVTPTLHLWPQPQPQLPPQLQPPQPPHGTMAEPISIGSSSSSSNSSPGGVDSVFTIHFDKSEQTVKVSVEATAEEIAETLYQAINWTKSREGWWWKPNRGRNLDKILDDEPAWAELIAEGRSRRHVWGLAPNEWADSPTAARNN